MVPYEIIVRGNCKTRFARNPNPTKKSSNLAANGALQLPPINKLPLSISTLYIFVPRVQDGEAFRRDFNSQDRLENAFLRIKIAHQGLSAWRRGAKMYKVESMHNLGLKSQVLEVVDDLLDPLPDTRFSEVNDQAMFYPCQP